MQDSVDRLVGTTIDGRFRLDRLLGAGGMGKVYAGVQLSVGRKVAVKVLRSDLSGVHALQQRFFREAEVLGSLRHPNVVGLVDFGRDEEIGSLYIAMDYVDGRSLTEFVSSGRLPLGVSLAISRQICSGLAEAHALGVIHRDLKPDNIMLQTTAEGALLVKILDFGIALPSGTDETRFTSTGAILGSPNYMSPEQAQDKPIGVQSDIYSVGVMLYEMIAGVVPFSADTPLAVLFKTVNERHTPLQELLNATEIRGPIGELLDDLLDKDPAKRPASALELARRIDQICDGLEAPTSVDLPTLETMLQPAMPPSQPGLADGSTARDGEPVGPMPVEPGAPIAPLIVVLLLVVGGIFIVAGVAGGLFIASMGDDEPQSVAAMPAPAPKVAEPTPVPREPAAIERPKPVPDPPTTRSTPKKAKKKPKKRHGKPQKHAKPGKPKKNAKPSSKSSGACQRKSCNVTLTTREAHYACQAGATCIVECTGGDCSQVCQGSTCTFNCAAGGCSQRCMGESTCTVSCAGGGCERTEFPGAKMVETD